MEWINILRARLRTLFRREGVLRDIEEELRIHVEMETERNIERGMPPDEAQAAARKSFGRLSRNTELSYDIRGGGRLEMVWQDLRYGARMLLKNPGFTLVVLLTLGLGIGANTAIFSVINAVMLRQLPFPNAARLVRLNESNPERGWPTFSVSHPNFLDWRARNQTFEALAATIGEDFTLNAGGEIEVVRGAAITADFLPALGITPTLGRNFLPEEDRPGGNTRVALLTYVFWQRRFGGDRAIVGKTLQISDNTFTVVGVLPDSFNWGVRNELFTPLAPDPTSNRGNHNLQVI